MKTKIIPFDLETVKKIQAGEIEGRIVFCEGVLYYKARVICFDRKLSSQPIVALYATRDNVLELILICNMLGECPEGRGKLLIELPEEAPEEQHPIEESELYQTGYKVGFEAGRCVAFDDKKGCAIKKETQKHEFKVGDLVKYKDGENHTGAIYEIIEIEGNVATLQNIFKTTLTHSLDVLELVEEKKQNEFKPFDKVLVYNRQNGKWFPNFFSHIASDGRVVTITNGFYESDEVVNYEGNEHLVGTTDKPKEE